MGSWPSGLQDLGVAATCAVCTRGWHSWHRVDREVPQVTPTHVPHSVRPGALPPSRGCFCPQAERGTVQAADLSSPLRARVPAQGPGLDRQQRGREFECQQPPRGSRVATTGGLRLGTGQGTVSRGPGGRARGSKIFPRIKLLGFTTLILRLAGGQDGLRRLWAPISGSPSCLGPLAALRHTVVRGQLLRRQSRGRGVCPSLGDARPCERPQPGPGALAGPTTSTWPCSCSCSSCACCPPSSPSSTTGRLHTAGPSGAWPSTVGSSSRRGGPHAEGPPNRPRPGRGLRLGPLNPRRASRQAAPLLSSS